MQIPDQSPTHVGGLLFNTSLKSENLAFRNAPLLGMGGNILGILIPKALFGLPSKCQKFF
jgi:hypothetical protein